MLQATVSGTKQRLFASIDAVNKSDNAGINLRMPIGILFLFQREETTSQPIRVYDVPRIPRKNHWVRRQNLKLGAFSCKAARSFSLVWGPQGSFDDAETKQ